MTRCYFTIGHSNRSIDIFIALLRENGITLLVDVRSMPRSRYNPQFNDAALRTSVNAHSIAYHHLPKLGGLRGDYKAYMRAPGFFQGITELTALHETQICAVMCAEAKWQNCHRRYIADHLLATGNEVRHIIAAGQVEQALLPALELPLGF